MAIFRRRPLAAGCLVFILCVAAAYRLGGLFLLLVPIIALFLVVGCLFFRRRAPYTALYLLLIVLAVALGFGRVVLDRAVHRDLESTVGSEVTLTLRVDEVLYESDYRAEYVVSVNGKSAAVLRADTELQPTPGTVITGTFRAESLSYESYYDGQENTYFSQGRRVILIPAEIENATPGAAGFHARLSAFRAHIAAQLRGVIQGEAGDLAAAMLIGDKSGLDDVTVRDFRRTGVSHLLAISGLHLAILAGFFDRLLLRFHAGKRLRVGLTMAFCFLYCLLTGASYSTLRAALMLSMVYLAFFCRSDADPVTSLLFAGALIVMISPFAVFGVSYQMTMLATFGILAYRAVRQRLCALIPAGKGIAGAALRLLRTLLASLCVTFCSTVAVLPVQWLTFGEISLVSFVTNLIILPLVPALLVFSLVALTLSFLPALALPFSFTAGLLSGILQTVTARLSAATTPLSLRYSFVPFVLIPMFLLLAALLMADLKKLAPLALAPVPAAIAAFLVLMAVNGNFSQGFADTVYCQNGSNEGFLLFGGGNGVICDISGGRESHLNAEYRALRALGATEVRVLLLPQYKDAYPYTLSAFSAQVLVREVWIPEPDNDEERQILFNLAEVAQKRGFSLAVFSPETPLTIFRTGKVTVSKKLYERRSVKPAFTVRFDFPSSSLLYVSDAYPEYAADRGREIGEGADVLLFGCSGPSMKKTVPVPAGFPLVILTTEEQLKYLTVNPDCNYLYLPQKFRVRLK